MSSLSSDLLKQAKILANLDITKPKGANIRRAISTSYYAFFHFLVDEATGMLVGTSQSDKPLRDLLSRCFIHGKMKSACGTIFGLVTNPTPASQVYAPFAPSILLQANDLQVVTKTFKDLQEHRHRADYDRRERYTRTQALKSIADVEEAIRAWKRIKNADRRVIQLVAVMLLHSEEIQKRQHS